MKKRLFGFGIWLALAACLYFFENNGGTRAVLLCTLLVPLIPALRKAFFVPDGEEEPKAPEGRFNRDRRGGRGGRGNDRRGYRGDRRSAGAAAQAAPAKPATPEAAAPAEGGNE